MENKIGYEDGKAVHVTDFEFPDNDQPVDRHEKLREFVLEIRLETLREFVALLLEGDADVNEAGLRAHLIAFGMKQHPAQTQMELAAALHLNQSSISRGIKKNCKISSKFAELWGSLA